MKRLRVAFVLAGLALGSLAPAQATVETYDIDFVHSWAGFTVSHLFTQVPGFFSEVKGTFDVDREHLDNSTAGAVIEMACITTNTRMRNDALRSTTFFAVGTFPNTSFKSTAWKCSGSDTYAVLGDLTIFGAERRDIPLFYHRHGVTI